MAKPFPETIVHDKTTKTAKRSSATVEGKRRPLTWHVIDIAVGCLASHCWRRWRSASSTTSVCCSSTTRRFRSLAPRAHRHRMRTAKRGRIRRLRIMGTVPCLGQVRSPRTFLIRTVITLAPARPDVRTGDYNVIRRFLSTGSIRRTSSS